MDGFRRTVSFGTNSNTESRSSSRPSSAAVSHDLGRSRDLRASIPRLQLSGTVSAAAPAAYLPGFSPRSTASLASPKQPTTARSTASAKTVWPSRADIPSNWVERLSQSTIRTTRSDVAKAYQSTYGVEPQVPAAVIQAENPDASVRRIPCTAPPTGPDPRGDSLLLVRYKTDRASETFRQPGPSGRARNPSGGQFYS